VHPTHRDVDILLDKAQELRDRPHFKKLRGFEKGAKIDVYRANLESIPLNVRGTRFI
jgi:hypothetical protein